MLLSLRKNGLTSLFKEVRVSKVIALYLNSDKRSSVEVHAERWPESIGLS